MQPGLTLEQPRTGFHVASVHSILVLSLMFLTYRRSNFFGNRKADQMSSFCVFCQGGWHLGSSLVKFLNERLGIGRSTCNWVPFAFAWSRATRRFGPMSRT